MTVRPPDPDEPLPDDRGDGPGPEEIAARWEQIVADLRGPGGPTLGAPDDAGPGPRADAGAPAEAWGDALGGPTGAGAADFRSWTPAEDPDEDHFVPPDPEPVGGDPMLTLAWVVAAGFPVLMLLVVVAWRDAPTTVLWAAAAAWLAAIGALLWRMPHTRDDDEGPGAVV